MPNYFANFLGGGFIAAQHRARFDILPRLGAVRLDGQPLEVVERVMAASAQRLDVVGLVAWAWAAPFVVGGAGVFALEFADDGFAAGLRCVGLRNCQGDNQQALNKTLCAWFHSAGNNTCAASKKLQQN